MYDRKNTVMYICYCYSLNKNKQVTSPSCVVLLYMLAVDLSHTSEQSKDGAPTRNVYGGRQVRRTMDMYVCVL